MSQYKIGTATFTNGSATVTGTGTAWLANVAIGDYIVRVGDNVAYIVGGVASDTSLTLTAPYGGVTGAGVSYVAHRDFHPNGAPKFTNGDVEFAAIQNEWNRRDPASFGTAASADLTTSATDTTVGRVLKVGDGGLLGQAITLTASDNLNNLTATGFYFNSTAGNTPGNNYPFASAGALINIYRTGTNQTQTFIPYSGTDSATVETWVRSYGVAGWSAWSKQYGTSNLNRNTFGGVANGVCFDIGFAISATTARFVVRDFDFGEPSSLVIGAGNFTVNSTLGVSFGSVSAANINLVTSIGGKGVAVIEVTGLSGMTLDAPVQLRAGASNSTIEVA